MSKVVKEDVQRDRRRLPGEQESIERTLSGEKRADRERSIKMDDAKALRALFHLAIYTGLLQREAYTLRRGQFNLVGKVICARVSKQ